MIRNLGLTQLLFTSVLWITACATTGYDGGTPTDRRDEELQMLQLSAGAPVTLEVNELGITRVLSMTSRFPVPGHAGDPAQAAMSFLAAHHNAFQLDASDVADFVVTRIDVESKLNVSHVTLQRTFHGIPVFQGAITVHMDSRNRVFRAVGDECYRIATPTNRIVLSPSAAADAAGRALGVALSPALVASDGQSTTFSSPGALDPVKVEPWIFQVTPTSNRFAYQVLVSWLDGQRQLQYQLALVDAEDGSLLASHSLVKTFTGRVFNVNAQPTAGMTTDLRTVVSFDGTPAASPNGWVGAGRKTVGNNAVAATDLNADNVVGTNETQPTADANNSFDFPFDPTQDASNFKEAAVANAFFLVNDYHDRAYLLGFTEAAGNFQAKNFGRGGKQNDPVNVDAQDGKDINKAFFATPPDGSPPRMEMFLFTLNGGPREDGDFDVSIIYHESSHGLSNRLVGGGSTTCLLELQSDGMDEGWGDFISSSFRNNPVIGAYASGNATSGLRMFPMDNSPWTYNDIKNGTLDESHKAGELWAATLWDVRKLLGAATVEQLVVSGMKLTPCKPTMLQARDAIIQADANINAGANKCKLWTAFARRLMGAGASSANASSTTDIVTSDAMPPGCNGNPFTYVRPRDQQLACFGIAFTPNFPSNCRDILDPDDKQMCFGMSELLPDPCLSITDTNLQQACLSMSVAPSSPSGCSNITDVEMQNFCFGVASGGSMPNCNNVTDGNTRALCLAMAIHDPSTCSNITNTNDSLFCQGVASRSQTPCISIQ
ncbi:MAG TPA: extracellular metalloproteinase [Kofleriaceae bacterium]